MKTLLSHRRSVAVRRAAAERRALVHAVVAKLDLNERLASTVKTVADRERHVAQQETHVRDEYKKITEHYAKLDRHYGDLDRRFKDLKDVYRKYDELDSQFVLASSDALAMTLGCTTSEEPKPKYKVKYRRGYNPGDTPPPADTPPKPKSMSFNAWLKS